MFLGRLTPRFTGAGAPDARPHHRAPRPTPRRPVHAGVRRMPWHRRLAARGAMGVRRPGVPPVLRHTCWPLWVAWDAAIRGMGRAPPVWGVPSRHRRRTPGLSRTGELHSMTPTNNEPRSPVSAAGQG